MMNISGVYDEEREKYYQSRRILEQKSRVTYKSCNTLTSEAYIWTYRTTSCDVLSIITTTVPMKDGLMKDIKINNKEGITIRQRSHVKALKDSPFQIKGLHVDLKEEKKKLNKILYAERKVFMTKLNISRYYRSKVENDSATKVQSIYRGYYTRSNSDRITDSVQINSQIRGNIKSYLANRYGMVISLTSFKSDRMNIRNRSASMIQDKFICYLSRQCLRRRRYERCFKQRMQAVIAIQSRQRGNSARLRVALLMNKVRSVITSNACIRIQTCFRSLCSRRKVRRRMIVLRWIAASNIINWYRARYSRRIANQIFLAMYAGKANNGALRMQKLIRQFLAVCRVNRIRLRRMYATLFVSATTINCLVRRFLAKALLRHRKDLKMAKKLEEEEVVRQAALVELQRKIQEEEKELLDSADIFLNASLGKTAEVEDIFTGLVSDEEHTPTDVNTTGDTVLTIAALKGNIELVRKSLLWGFDVNHRNDAGDTALTSAAKNNHFMIMQYLLSLPVTLAKEKPDYTPLDAVSEDDMGVLLVAAAANCNNSGMEMLVALLDLGFDVNSVDPVSGMTAIHAVCEIGLEEAFQLLHSKYKADIKVRDNLGQTPLHKACTCSIIVVQQILGLDPAYSSYMSEEERTECIADCDANEKDGAMHAALGGQYDIIEMFDSIMDSFPPTSASKTEPVTWISADIVKTINLVELGNFQCVEKILASGFDFSQVEEETGNTLAIIACKTNNADMISLLMEEGADFSFANAEGNSAMHYAAMETSGVAISHLLTHSKAARCGVNEKSLLAINNNGDTPLHCAAKEGLELKIDLLAPNAMEQSMKMQNSDGMTPFLIACSMNYLELAGALLKRGPDINMCDTENRNCLWHILHPNPSIMEANPSKRPLCSEHVQLNSAMKFDKYSLKDTMKLAGEVHFISELLGKNHSMRLYSEEGITAKVEALVETAAKLNAENQAAAASLAAASASKSSSRPTTKQKIEVSPPTTEERLLLESGDVLVREWSMTMIKKSLEVITQLDCWRLVLTSIAADQEGSLKVFSTLLVSGAVGVLSNSGDPTAGSGTLPDEPHSTVQSRGAQADSSSITTAQVQALQGQYFLGINIMGWFIRIKHMKAIELFIKKGYDLSFPIDRDGNSFLHFVGLYAGSITMLNLAFDKKNPNKKPLIEQFNKAKESPAGVAVKAGNFKVFKRLYDLKAAPRFALRSKYMAWALAFVRQRELTERMTQCGKIEEDDDIWCGKVGKKFPAGDLYAEYLYI